jgi:hypothetical protein
MAFLGKNIFFEKSSPCRILGVVLGEYGQEAC